MDGIVGKTKENDFVPEKSTSPRYGNNLLFLVTATNSPYLTGSLKFGQSTNPDEPVTVESYKQHYLDMRSEEDQSFLFDMFFKGKSALHFGSNSYFLKR